MSVLDGCRLKLGRAEEQLKALKVEIGPKERHTVIVWAKPDVETGQFPCKLPPRRVVDVDRCSLLAGEIIYELRSALDYLIFEAIGLNNNGSYYALSMFPIIDRMPRQREIGGGDPYFPKEGDPRGYPYRGDVDRAVRAIGGSSKTSFRKLSDDHRAIVCKYQSYRQGWYEEAGVLATLAKLSNQDKHRLVLFTYHGAEAGSLVISPIKCFNVDGIRGHWMGHNIDPSGRLVDREPDAQVISLIPGPISGPNPCMQVKVEFTPQITIQDKWVTWGDNRTSDAHEILTWMAVMVAKIVSEFEPAFR